MKLTKYFIPFLVLAPVFALTSCMDDDDDNVDTDWKTQNEEFFEEQKALMKDGELYYTQVHPTFAPELTILMKWHNDRSLTANELKPLDNSTCDFTYAMCNCEGEVVQTSYSMTTYGDSIFRSKPCNMIAGVWTALTQMHVGDTCTVVIPYTGGYGQYATGSLKAYSTLVYELKLKAIPGFEIPVN